MNTDSYSAIIPFPVRDFRLGLRMQGENLLAIDFLPASFSCFETAQSADLVRQLNAYLKLPSNSIDVPVSRQGTAFQQRVWQALKAIPVGESLCYGELARQLATSARAVGNACRANPLPIVIPCHRVVSVSGLGGFMGQRQGAELAIKQWLLEHEQCTKTKVSRSPNAAMHA